MKTLKIASLTLVLLALTAPAHAQMKGWGIGAGVHDGDFGAHARKDFWLGGDISHLTGQFGVYDHWETTFKADADYHFMLNPDANGRFYPLVGLQLAFNSDVTELGANLGGGLNFMFTPRTAGFVEVKYVVGDLDGVTAQAGFYF